MSSFLLRLSFSHPWSHFFISLELTHLRLVDHRLETADVFAILFWLPLRIYYHSISAVLGLLEHFHPLFYRPSSYLIPAFGQAYLAIFLVFQPMLNRIDQAEHQPPPR